MSANLLDLWKIGSKIKPDSSKEEHPNSEKVKKYEKVEFKNSKQYGKKNFPTLNLTRKKVAFVNIFCKTLHINFAVVSLFQKVDH